jgi:hypothetical protein
LQLVADVAADVAAGAAGVAGVAGVADVAAGVAGAAGAADVADVADAAGVAAGVVLRPNLLRSLAHCCRHPGFRVISPPSKARVSFITVSLSAGLMASQFAIVSKRTTPYQSYSTRSAVRPSAGLRTQCLPSVPCQIRQDSIPVGWRQALDPGKL